MIWYVLGTYLLRIVLEFLSDELLDLLDGVDDLEGVVLLAGEVSVFGEVLVGLFLKLYSLSLVFLVGEVPVRDGRFDVDRVRVGVVL